MVVCAGAAATHIVLHADKAVRSYYGNFDMGLDLFPSARCQAIYRPARAVGCALLGSHAHRTMIGDVGSDDGAYHEVALAAALERLEDAVGVGLKT